MTDATQDTQPIIIEAETIASEKAQEVPNPYLALLAQGETLLDLSSCLTYLGQLALAFYPLPMGKDEKLVAISVIWDHLSSLKDAISLQIVALEDSLE